MADSEVIRLMRQFKASLLSGEKAQMQAMASRWLNVERRLSGNMELLAHEMAGIKADGGTVSPEMLMTNVRYRELLVQLNHELEGYSDYADRTITDRQRQLARLGIKHGEQAIKSSGIQAGFNRLPVEAVENLVGFASDGTPLNYLLMSTWPDAAVGMTHELINGIALGYNPRKVAKNMAQGSTATLDRMMVIARTEQLRAYRSANLDSYRESGVVTSYKRLATHDNRVCAACLMDEGTVYQLDEEMPEHPQGRCTLVPVVDGMPEPQWKQGQEWFEEQDPATQKDILGKGRYYAWQNGDFALSDLVTVKPNGVWGDSLQVTPLKDLMGPKIANILPVVPKSIAAPVAAIAEKVPADKIDPKLLRWTAGRTDGFIDGGETYRVYHGTNSSRLESIRENGLRPPDEMKDSAKWFMVTTNIDAAQHFSVGQGGSGEPVVLEFRIPAGQLKEMLWPGTETSFDDVQHAIRKPLTSKFLFSDTPLSELVKP